MRMGIGELAVILAILVLLFGAKRLPQLADGMGKAIRNFKRGLSTEDEDVTPPQNQVSEKSSASTLEGAAADARPVERKS
jgi:sec-independent protein translocase protein TatA